MTRYKIVRLMKACLMRCSNWVDMMSLRSSVLNRCLGNSRGVTIVEGLIAAGILAIIVFGVVQLIGVYGTNSIKLEGRADCRQRAQTLVAAFKNSDNKLRIDNPYFLNSLPTDLRKPLFGIFPLIGKPLSFRTTNAWMAINSGSNWALALYNAVGSTYCDANPVNVATGAGLGARVVSTSNPSSSLAWIAAEYPKNRLRDEEVFLNIKRRDVSGSAPADCAQRGTLRIVPLSPANVDEPYANAGLEITSSVVYRQNNDSLELCQASTMLKPDGDNAPPVVSTGVFSVPLPQTIKTDSGNGLKISCDTGRIDATVVAAESGVVFGCYLHRQMGAPADATVIPAENQFVDCRDSAALFADTVMIPPGPIPPALGMVPLPATAAAETTVRFSFTNLPEGWYTLFVRAYDTAQNSRDQRIVFGIDLTRPGAVELIEPAAITGFNSPPFSRGHIPPILLNLSIPGLFQCQADGGGFWTIKVQAGTEVSTVGGSFKFTGTRMFLKADGSPGQTTVPTQTSGGCVNQMAHPGPLGTGNYTMTATACDACGFGLDSSKGWWVDLAGFTAKLVGSPGPITFPPNVDPKFGLEPGKPFGLPYAYGCPTGNGYSSQLNSCTISVPPASKPCAQNFASPFWGGVCMLACDGCGVCKGYAAGFWQILAGVGQSCGKVDCEASLICATAGPSAGSCITPPAVCYNDTDCGGAPCIGSFPETCDTQIPPVCGPPAIPGACSPKPQKNGGPLPNLCPYYSTCPISP